MLLGTRYNTLTYSLTYLLTYKDTGNQMQHPASMRQQQLNSRMNSYGIGLEKSGSVLRQKVSEVDEDVEMIWSNARRITLSCPTQQQHKSTAGKSTNIQTRGCLLAYIAPMLNFKNVPKYFKIEILKICSALLCTLAHRSHVPSFVRIRKQEVKVIGQKAGGRKLYH